MSQLESMNGFMDIPHSGQGMGKTLVGLLLVPPPH